jgi:hypothetical protein
MSAVVVAITPNDAENTAAIGTIGAMARTPARYVGSAGAGLALSAAAAILRITMRGPNLLLAHLAAVERLVEEEPERERRPSAAERLEAALGPETARELVTSLTRPPEPS